MNEDLESVIKQRILDEAWDDVVRVKLPSNYRENFTNLEEISFEKSSKGLGEIYEDKFKKEVLSMTGPSGATDKDLKDPAKLEIETLFKKLCYNLDILSNLSFVPKALTEPAQVVSNVSAINMEERIPLFMSNANRKAPQEMFETNKKVMHDGDLVTSADHKKKRRLIKNNVRTRLKEKAKKKVERDLEHSGMSKHMYNVMKDSKATLKNLKLKKGDHESIKFTKSSQFFKNLQESTANPKPKKPKGQIDAPDLNGKTSKNYKL
jgi:U3 small nucleolar RNA-associated protein MPP10